MIQRHARELEVGDVVHLAGRWRTIADVSIENATMTLVFTNESRIRIEYWAPVVCAA